MTRATYALLHNILCVTAIFTACFFGLVVVIKFAFVPFLIALFHNSPQWCGIVSACQVRGMPTLMQVMTSSSTWTDITDIKIWLSLKKWVGVGILGGLAWSLLHAPSRK